MIDFAGGAFRKGCNFGGLLFPAPADLACALCGRSWFNAARFSDVADFTAAIFERDGFFEQSEFFATAHFDQTRWPAMRSFANASSIVMRASAMHALTGTAGS